METKNSNRFGLECAFILGDLPMSARFFQLNLPISNLILTNLPRIFGLVAIFLAPPPIAGTPETAFTIKLYQQNPRIGSHDGFQIGLFCVGLASLTGKLTGVFFFPTVPLRFLHESCAGWCWCCIFLSFSFINIKTFVFPYSIIYTYIQSMVRESVWLMWLTIRMP